MFDSYKYPISLKSLSLSLNDKTDLKGDVKSITLDLPKGSLNIILGPENSGKSSLCKKLAGIDKNISGQILYFGMPFDRVKKQNFLLYIPSSNIFFENRKVIENLVILGEFANIPLKYIEKRIKKISPFYSLENIKNIKLIKLSKAIKSVIILCLIEIVLPEIVIISAQDFYGDELLEEFFFKRLVNLKNLGITIIVSTQRFSNIDNIDNIILLSDSKPVFVGNPVELLNINNPNDIQLTLLKKIEESYERIKIN